MLPIPSQNRPIWSHWLPLLRLGCYFWANTLNLNIQNWSHWSHQSRIFLGRYFDFFPRVRVAHKNRAFFWRNFIFFSALTCQRFWLRFLPFLVTSFQKQFRSLTLTTTTTTTTTLESPVSPSVSPLRRRRSRRRERERDGVEKDFFTESVPQVFDFTALLLLKLITKATTKKKKQRRQQRGDHSGALASLLSLSLSLHLSLYSNTHFIPLSLSLCLSLSQWLLSNRAVRIHLV